MIPLQILEKVPCTKWKTEKEENAICFFIDILNLQKKILKKGLKMTEICHESPSKS
jgi:hypothetical protein